MGNPQLGLMKHQNNPTVMMAFMKIQEKMKELMANPQPAVTDDDPEDEEEGDSLETQAITVLLKRGRAA